MTAYALKSESVETSLVIQEQRLCSSNEGGLGLIPGLERSLGGGHGNPLQYSFLENPHGQRSLVG